MFKTYKFMISLFWGLSALLSTSIGFKMYFEQKGDGEEVKLALSAIFVFMSVTCGLITVGTYLQKRMALFLVIPCLIFSIGYFIDHVLGEYVWAKYVYQSISMVSLNAATIHIIFRQKSNQVENA
jgi:hypothetical protein